MQWREIRGIFIMHLLGDAPASHRQWAHSPLWPLRGEIIADGRIMLKIFSLNEKCLFCLSIILIFIIDTSLITDVLSSSPSADDSTRDSDWHKCLCVYVSFKNVLV
jgi:hypothetical protein